MLFHRLQSIGRSFALSLAVALAYGMPAQLAFAADSALVPGDAAAGKLDSLALYKVKVEQGTRRTTAGTSRGYTLYYPEPNPNLPAGPYPLVELIHGFLMTAEQQSNNARDLAARGFVVVTPDLTKVLLGDDTRMQNVDDVLDFITWLIDGSKDKNSPHYSLIDPTRIALGGNSSGGAVCLESVIQAQKRNIPIKVMVSLDGVPWDRTRDEVADLKPLKLLSLRAEPALCNYHGKVLEFLHLMKFKTDDVLVQGAHHCDVENPTTMRCRCVCGTSDPAHRATFERLLYLYLRDSLDVRLVAGAPAKSFADTVADMQHEGKVLAHLDQHQPQQEVATSTIAPSNAPN